MGNIVGGMVAQPPVQPLVLEEQPRSADFLVQLRRRVSVSRPRGTRSLSRFTRKAECHGSAAKVPQLCCRCTNGPALSAGAVNIGHDIQRKR